jgi:DNA-binding NtrC family response regulator
MWFDQTSGCARPDQVRRVEYPEGTAEKPRLDVLVVDDERLIRWSLVETLRAAGHRVSEAADRAEALRALTSEGRGPDVVLLDYRLPDSSDLGLLASVRQLAPRASVILMTAFGTPDVLESALELGAYSVLNKPFEVQDVHALVLRAHARQPPAEI